VTYAFVADTMPLLEHEGIDARVYYVASAELFDALPRKRQHELFPEAHAFEAIGITGFTLPTLYRWYAPTPGARQLFIPIAIVTTSVVARQRSCSRRPASTAPVSSQRSRSTWMPRFARTPRHYEHPLVEPQLGQA